MRLGRLAILALSFWGSECHADSQFSPDALEQLLAHAQLQTEMREGDCAARLDRAEKEIGIAKVNPAFYIVLPAGEARLADFDYRLHLARAYCGAKPPRRDELLAALDGALRAVPLYRDRYDYQSMVIMQYDAAMIYRLLGDQDNAEAALEAAIRWDGDYGFADDAAENAEMLRSWKGLPPEPKPVADREEDPPSRSITLKFAWAPKDVDVALAADYLTLSDNVAVPSKASATVKRQIRADGEDWVLTTTELGDRRYSGLDELKATPYLMPAIATAAALQMLAPDVKVSGKGEFKNDVGPDQTSAILVRDIKAISGEFLDEDKLHNTLEPALLMGLSEQLLAREGGVAFKAEEDYDITTSAWIDATLDQGVWYDMQARLLLPGLAMIMDHDIHFAYSQSVPCTEGAVSADCAEILVHATPNAEALDRWLNPVRRASSLFKADQAHYSSSIDLRLVVDPKSLLPYVTEIRRHWYFAIDGQRDPLIGSEKAVSTYHYH